MEVQHGNQLQETIPFIDRKRYDKCAVTGGGRLFGKYYYKIET